MELSYIRFWIHLSLGFGFGLSLDMFLTPKITTRLRRRIALLKTSQSSRQILHLALCIFFTFAGSYFASWSYHHHDHFQWNWKMFLCLAGMNTVLRLCLLLAPQNFTLAESCIFSQALSLWTLDAIARTLYDGGTTISSSNTEDKDTFDSTMIYFLLQALIIGPFLIGIISYPFLRYYRDIFALSPWNNHRARVLLSCTFHGYFAYCVYFRIRPWVMLLSSKYHHHEANVEPFLWVLSFAFGNSRHLMVILWWIFCLALMVTGVRLIRSSSSDTSETKNFKSNKLQMLWFDFKRKYFHFIAVMMFAPALAAAPDLLALSFGVALASFVVLEYIRIFKLWIPVGSSDDLDQFLMSFTEQPLMPHKYEEQTRPATTTSSSSSMRKSNSEDSITKRKPSRLQQLSTEVPPSPMSPALFSTRSWDLGPLILSHIYLLLGCAIPLWLVESRSLTIRFHNSENGRAIELLGASSGIVSIGIADTFAAMVGHMFGRNKWFLNNPKRKKTIEGSIGCLLGCLIGWALMLSIDAIINGAYSVNEYQQLLFPLAITSLGIVLLEALSTQNDNILLPSWAVAFLLFFA